MQSLRAGPVAERVPVARGRAARAARVVGPNRGYLNQPGVGGVPTEPTVGATFLRGTQFADADGWVRFKTVYPSWYGGRTPHIRFKVLIDARTRVASQVFLPERYDRSGLAAKAVVTVDA